MKGIPMKRYTVAFTMLLTFALLFGLTACQQNEAVSPATDGVTESAPSSEQTTVPEITDSEPTAFTVPPDFEVRREQEEISLYPFTAEELDAALETVQEYLGDVFKELGVLTYEVECIAYDPIMTDVHVRQRMVGTPVDGWAESDYYERQMSFAVTYSDAYNHEKSNVISVSLSRKNAQSPWEFQASGVSVEQYSSQAMSAGELKNITDVSGRVLAGYEAGDDGYWLYLCDDNTGKTQLIQKACNLQTTKPETLEPDPTVPIPTEPPIQNSVPLAVWDESTYQVGSPVSPQPGDTGGSWNPSLADAYPSDGDCSAMQLLEKWMAVEGLTMEDLDERGCQQLVLVVARETDGVQTYTICYQKQADGSWDSVNGLTWMQGWTGSNGIMHGRKRNSDTSPAGLWSLGLAFGNSQKPAGLKMPWRDVTPNTDWVCDADSIYFNTWQERDDPTVTEAWSDDVEHLEDYPNAYAYACVIRFNTPPYTIPERGCAIFFHCSKGATGGCIGLPETDMVNTLLWMDTRLNPYILITGYQKEVN